eukprot:scaffold427_cov263-Pinguiococcus_pyrenoidosus.AAC.13
MATGLVMLNRFGSASSRKAPEIDEELHRKLEANLMGRRHEMHSRRRFVPDADFPPNQKGEKPKAAADPIEPEPVRDNQLTTPKEEEAPEESPEVEKPKELQVQPEKAADEVPEAAEKELVEVVEDAEEKQEESQEEEAKEKPASSREEMYQRSYTPPERVEERVEEAPDYSFDVSWPIHNQFAEDENYEECTKAYNEGGCEYEKVRRVCPASCGTVFERSYGHFIQGCYKRYDRRSCRAVDDQRIKMNVNQPKTQNHFTDVGFRKMRVPTYMVNLEDHSEDPKGSLTGWQLKKRIWDGTKPIIEKWTGKELKSTSLYGIRVYHNGAILASHCDRLPLVSSAIINVDQDVDEPWPLEIYDHSGKAHNVTMAPGDMVLYESHVCVHGRPFPLKGRYYANLFVHFEPMDGSHHIKKQLRGN